MDVKNHVDFDFYDYHIFISAEDGKGPVLVGELLHEWGHEAEEVSLSEAATGEIVWRLKLSPNFRPHQRLLSDLARQSYVKKLMKGDKKK